MQPVSYGSAGEFHRWLQRNHATASELIVQFYRKDSGQGGITYAEALDEALCFGWIDGLRKRFDASSYTIRFSPRKPGSIWSRVNIRHVERLTAARRMQPAGLAAFRARVAQRTGVYSFENRPQALPASLARVFRADPPAWKFFQAQPPGYQRTILWWVLSAKRDDTRERRLARVVAESAAGRRVDLLSPNRRSI